MIYTQYTHIHAIHTLIQDTWFWFLLLTGSQQTVLLRPAADSPRPQVKFDLETGTFVQFAQNAFPLLRGLGPGRSGLRILLSGGLGILSLRFHALRVARSRGGCMAMRERQGAACLGPDVPLQCPPEAELRDLCAQLDPRLEQKGGPALVPPLPRVAFSSGRGAFSSSLLLVGGLPTGCERRLALQWRASSSCVP